MSSNKNNKKDKDVLENLRKERIRLGIIKENCIWGNSYCVIMEDSDEGDENHCPLCGCWFPKEGKVIIGMNCVDENEE